MGRLKMEIMGGGRNQSFQEIRMGVGNPESSPLISPMSWAPLLLFHLCAFPRTFSDIYSINRYKSDSFLLPFLVPSCVLVWVFREAEVTGLNTEEFHPRKDVGEAGRIVQPP